MLFISNTANIS